MPPGEKAGYSLNLFLLLSEELGPNWQEQAEIGN
jgi:hypothetical protein